LPPKAARGQIFVRSPGRIRATRATHDAVADAQKGKANADAPSYRSATRRIVIRGSFAADRQLLGT
jgi:hypothetical protein